MDYSLHQGGRAAIQFLNDLRGLSDPLEAATDAAVGELALADAALPDDPEALQAQLAPVLEGLRAFRVLRLARDWTLYQHGGIAMQAFEEIRDEVSAQLDELQTTPCAVSYADIPPKPDYWDGVEFHRSAGGWDGHDYMGFVHGELIHRHMVNPSFAGLIYANRKRVAEAAPIAKPAKILELGCCSGQFTQGLAEVFPDAEIWACDLSARQLEQAQRYANEQGLAWHLFQADAARTGRANNEFDLVTSYAMFHELPITAAEAVLRECLRVTRPGGYTVIGDVKAYAACDRYARWKNDYWNQVHGGDPYWRGYCSTDFGALARDIGFAQAEWRGLGEFQYPFALIARKASAA